MLPPYRKQNRMGKVFIQSETEKEIIYVSYYENMPIRFLKDKATGEIFVNSDDIVKALGQSDSFIDFLGTDEGLEYINEWKKNHPGEPFFGGAVKRR